MRIQFYDDPAMGPRPREEVRFNQIGLYVYEDRKRVAVGFDITPFLERPSIQVTMLNEEGLEVSNMTVIEAMQPNFNLTMHMQAPAQIQDEKPSENYRIEARLYYRSGEGERQVVDRKTRTFDPSKIGEQ
jgi:hypothetical protein